jgi:hypothetical protein
MTRPAPVRIPDRILAAFPAATAAPAHHTAAELHRLLMMLHTNGIDRVTIGHGRHCASLAAAAAITAAWTQRAGLITRIVSWPPDAASWLRPAHALVDEPTDAWIIADTPAGFAQLAQRLAHEHRWSATRTYGFAGVGSPDLLRLTGTDLSGMTGATATGDTWLIRHRTLIVHDAAEQPTP